jgi:hypothetical protein
VVPIMAVDKLLVAANYLSSNRPHRNRS